MIQQLFYNDTKQLKNLMRSLRIYNMRAYKQIIFKDRFNALKFTKHKNKYIADLMTDKLFEKVYGKCQVICEINGDKAKVIDIEPKEILLAGYRRILDTYKGIPYRDKQDLFKIKLIEGMKNE